MKKKLIKIFFILLGVGLISAIGVYLYVFHKPHRNVASEKPAFTITAIELLSEFESDETLAYSKYGDKAIQVNGTISEIAISPNTISIALEDAMSGISCSFDSISIQHLGINKFANLITGENITIKGKCDGYDMIMGVVLTRCTIVEQGE